MREKEMIRKIFLAFMLCLFSIVSLNAFTYSSSTQDGIFEDFNSVVQDTASDLNDDSVDKWQDDIEPLIEEIQELTQKKKQLLTEIQSLEKTKTLNESKASFLLQQEKNLLGNYGSIISIEKTEKDIDE